MKPVPTRPTWRRLAVVVAHADQQRADAVAALAVARHPAADDDLLARGVLDLQPVRGAPPGLVARVQALGDDALEALLLGGGEHLRAVADDVVGHPPAPAVAELELGQARAALGVGQLHERVPVEPQQVEDDVGDRRLLGQPADRALRADVHAPLQGAEARPALGVEGDDLAVEHGAVVAERAVEAPDLGIARRDVEQVARVQAQAARLGVADRAHAVPLDLEGPVLVVARQRAGARHHRHDLLGHGLAPPRRRAGPCGGSSSSWARRPCRSGTSA